MQIHKTKSLFIFTSKIKFNLKDLSFTQYAGRPNYANFTVFLLYYVLQCTAPNCLGTLKDVEKNVGTEFNVISVSKWPHFSATLRRSKPSHNAIPDIISCCSSDVQEGSLIR